VTDISKGKKIRSPSLIKGGNYVVRFWGKTPVFELVEFMGFTADGVEHDKPTRQLKEMLPTDLYKFRMLVDGTLFDGIMQDMYLVDARTKGRITFTMPVGTDEVTATEEVLPPISDAVEAAEEAAAPAEIEEVTEPTGSFAEMDEVAETIAAEVDSDTEVSDTVTSVDSPLAAFVRPAVEDVAEDEVAEPTSQDETLETQAADESSEQLDDESEGDSADEPVFAAPADETPTDRKRRLDAQKKREKRAAAKAANAGAEEQPNA
jgi:hypothetical protein